MSTTVQEIMLCIPLFVLGPKWCLVEQLCCIIFLLKHILVLINVLVIYDA